jgi:hypothetical protein
MNFIAKSGNHPGGSRSSFFAYFADKEMLESLQRFFAKLLCLDKITIRHRIRQMNCRRLRA